jgi:phosphatidylserine decarboxylase
MKLTEYGLKEWLLGGIFSVLLIALCLALVFYWKKPALGYSLAGVVCFVYFCFAAFFRDPYRKIPQDENVLVSPADGVVKDIELIKGTDENEFFKNQDIIRVGIFLSVLDVHINRAPCNLEIADKKYRKGKYHDARSPLASKENEAMTIFCNASVPEKQFPIIVRQISGAIAKRIVCAAEPGDKFEKGQKFGMIKFGSRTELYLPAEQWMTLTVKIGDPVYAGESVVARINMDMKPKTKK